MRIWLISDTHFGHDNIYTFVRQDGVTRVRERFKNVAEGDAYMLQRWADLVKPEDHIYHLGDVAMPRRLQKWIYIIKKLPGHKRLVLGNHDKAPAKDYLDAGFEKLMSVRTGDKKRITLSHYPLHPQSLGDSLNIHGHIHERAPYGPNYVNVSVERTNYEPVDLDSLTDLKI